MTDGDVMTVQKIEDKLRLTDGDVMTVQKIVDRFEEMLRDEKLKKEIEEFVKKSSRATSEELNREFTI